ncbi:hypothetical protein [Caulobacter sp. FWC2]|uniref:hypothetical protein n=1 Tax=Caulobacter sp. FWC2 TaxID=69664 RepID=UPI0018ECF875|nr:hypothetical protein [Caulobacter sp. FWC2]
MSDASDIDEQAWRAALTLALVEKGFRNSGLEELHTGVSPATAVGDYSDVKVITPYGEIAWADVARLDDAEMKALMIEVVDRVFTILRHPEPFLAPMAAQHWNRPSPDPAMMDQVARYEARQRGMAEAEVWKTWPLDDGPRRPPLRNEHRVAQTPIAPPTETDERHAPPSVPPSVEVTPDSLRALAEAPIADPAWIAKARQALAAAAEGWERAELRILDEIEVGTYGQD